MIGSLNGDIIVGLLGTVTALFLVSRHSALQALSTNRRVGYAAVWAVLIGVVAAIMSRIYE